MSQNTLNTLDDYQNLLDTMEDLDQRRDYLYNNDLFKSPIGDHETSRHHSEIIDQFIGFNIHAVEKKLLRDACKKVPLGNVQSWGASIHQGNQTWVGLWHQSLQTPYSELKLICDYLKPKNGSLVLDLGAGYGRLGIVLHLLYPESKFLGFEFVAERVHEGVRILSELKCNNSQLLQQDLTQENFILPEAEFYFIYDYGTLRHIRQTLKQIEQFANSKKFKVIARGKGVISLIEKEHPWLSKVFPVIREENFNIYSMSGT